LLLFHGTIDLVVGWRVPNEWQPQFVQFVFDECFVVVRNEGRHFYWCFGGRSVDVFWPLLEMLCDEVFWLIGVMLLM
jgi:hypothetical protein